MTTIVYAHPNPESFNHSILQSISSLLTANGDDYNVIDLYADGFNPVLTPRELELAHHGKTDDPLVERHQEMLRNTGYIIFIFPIWWGMMPAMIKGFIDKVFMKGIVYDTTPEGAILPMLSADPAIIITTSQEESAVLDEFFNSVFIPQVLNPVGINRVSWHNCDDTVNESDIRRKAFIHEILVNLAK